jgi:hypothetical protein
MSGGRPRTAIGTYGAIYVMRHGDRCVAETRFRDNRLRRRWRAQPGPSWVTGTVLPVDGGVHFGRFRLVELAGSSTPGAMPLDWSGRHGVAGRTGQFSSACQDGAGGQAVGEVAQGPHGWGEGTSAMHASDPMKDVSVVSTGSVVIRPEHVGPTKKNLYVWLFTSRRWTQPLPINAYVIEHREGVVLFDTGQDRASVTDPNYFPGGVNGLVYSRLAKFDIGSEDTLTAGLRHLGHKPQDVHTAVLSHLHQDHIGGLRELTNSRILLSQAEWDTMAKPLPEARGFLPKHIDLPGLMWDRMEPDKISVRVGGHEHTAWCRKA